MASYIRSRRPAYRTGNRKNQRQKVREKKYVWQRPITQIGFVLSRWLIVFFFVIQKYDIEITDFYPATIKILSPKYLSPNEYEELIFSFSNKTDNRIHLKVYLIDNGVNDNFIGLENGNDLFLVDLKNPDTIIKKINVLFSWNIDNPFEKLGKDAGLALYGRAGAKTQQTVALPIYVAPLPWINTLNKSLLSLVGFFITRHSITILLPEKKEDS